MSALVVLSDISKRHGAHRIFDHFSFAISERERMGILGPNGAGKSTLLKLIAGIEELDDGSITRQKNLRVGYVAQHADFPATARVSQLAEEASLRGAHTEAEQAALMHMTLGRFEVDFHDALVSDLSGGQQKRLQLALAFCELPDLLLLDEPTNHLDIESIMLLESILNESSIAWVAVSHDRWFLENAPARIAEVNRQFPDGVFACDGSYLDYLGRRETFLAAADKSLSTLENKVRGEQAWLRQGARARSTKSKSRIQKSSVMMEELSFIRARTSNKKVELSFQFSERKTKRLVEFTNVDKSYGEKKVVSRLNLKLLAGQALGLLGRNGSGKTTLVNLLSGALAPDAGTIKRASDVRISYFTQLAAAINGKLPLSEVLAPESDSVVFQGREIHVASWARRFKFSFEQLHQPFDTLSGGEKARARVAHLMLQTPDVLILDEPTNDLDIETLEMLEQSITEFKGAIVLVSHDRFMLTRVCTHFLGLDGAGGSREYAEYQQWEYDMLNPAGSNREAKPVDASSGGRGNTRTKRLSYQEQREFDGMEAAIAKSERKVEEFEEQVTLENNRGNAERLSEVCLQLADAQKLVEKLYTRWAELEEKQK